MNFGAQFVFGSDEFTPYDAVYSWGANQMSHAMMGFFVGSLVALRFPHLRKEWKAANLAAANPPIKITRPQWVFRRTWNVLIGTALFLIPLLKIIPDWQVQNGVPDRLVAINASEFFLDKFTDIAFWWTGMYLAYAFLFPIDPATNKYYLPFRGWWRVAFILPTTALLIFLFGAWVDQKRVFDGAGLPPNYARLCNYPPEDIDPFYRSMLGDFYRKIEPKYRVKYINSGVKTGPIEWVANNRQHCIICGGTAIDRSRLAVSIASEYAANARPVLYVTAAKLLENPADTASATDANTTLNCLVIDDLSSEFPHDSANIKAFAGFVRSQVTEKGASTVWVVSGHPGDAGYQAWVDIIKNECLAENEDVTQIRLADREKNQSATTIESKTRVVSQSPLLQENPERRVIAVLPPGQRARQP